MAIALQKSLWSGRPLTIANSQSSVLPSIRTVILQHVLSRDAIIIGGELHANADFDFFVYVNDILKSRKRTTWTERNLQYSILEACKIGDVVKIEAINLNHNVHDVFASVQLLIQ